VSVSAAGHKRRNGVGGQGIEADRQTGGRLGKRKGQLAGRRVLALVRIGRSVS